MMWLLAVAVVAILAELWVIARQRRRIAQLCASIAPLYLEYAEMKRRLWVLSARTPEEAAQRAALLDDDVAGHA